jgi:hypothetical protein
MKLYFSVVIFLWSFGIINASTIKCWAMCIAQAGASGVQDVALTHYSCTDSINQTEIAIFIAYISVSNFDKISYSTFYAFSLLVLYFLM